MHTRQTSGLWRYLAALVGITFLLLGLAQCRTPRSVQEQPTRPREVAGESGEKVAVYLPMVVKSASVADIVNPPPEDRSATREAELLAAINAQRAQAGCSALEHSEPLARAARNHSLDMAQNNFFSHTGSDGSKPVDRTRREGYQFRGGFETISAGNETAEATLAAWMNSRPHREILLNCTLDDIGLGFVHDTDGTGFTYYWTAVLGSR